MSRLQDQVEFGTARQEFETQEDFIVDRGQNLKKVDLACGSRKKEGFLGLDKEVSDGVDIVHDLMKFPWPFEDESVYEFNCEHFIEHIPHDLYKDDGTRYEKDGLFVFIEEVYRCLMPGGSIFIIAPYHASLEAWQDPTHRRAISERTFDYFNQEITSRAGLSHYMPKVNFEKLIQKRILNPEWEGKSEEAQRWAMSHYFNVCREIQVELRKKPLKS